jgi:hypothetical protein
VARRFSGPAGPDDATWPGGPAGQPGDATWSGEPASDDGWDDGDEWPDDALPWPPAPRRPRRPGAQVAALAAIALVAAGIGGAAIIVARDLSSSPASPASQPSVQAPAQSGGNSLPPGSGSGALPGSSGQMFVGGKVTAVSSTSITIGGQGRGITAVVTAATKITGNVSGISGIKVGDVVTAQLTQSGGRITAVAIEDPAQLPGGGSPP